MDAWDKMKKSPNFPKPDPAGKLDMTERENILGARQVDKRRADDLIRGLEDESRKIGRYVTIDEYIRGGEKDLGMEFLPGVKEYMRKEWRKIKAKGEFKRPTFDFKNVPKKGESNMAKDGENGKKKKKVTKKKVSKFAGKKVTKKVTKKKATKKRVVKKSPSKAAPEKFTLTMKDVPKLVEGLNKINVKRTRLGKERATVDQFIADGKKQGAVFEKGVEDALRKAWKASASAVKTPEERRATKGTTGIKKEAGKGTTKGTTGIKKEPPNLSLIHI